MDAQTGLCLCCAHTIKNKFSCDKVDIFKTANSKGSNYTVEAEAGANILCVKFDVF